MRRREFIALLGVAAAARPLAARAQQAALPVVGFLHTASPETRRDEVAAFNRGLAEAGRQVGRDVEIEYRWAQDQYQKLPELVADLVRRPVAVIVTSSLPAALAAKAATTTIPIVFQSGEDPVKARLVASLNRPGGNVTGVSSLNTLLGAKRLELLRELVPAAVGIFVLANPRYSVSESMVHELQEVARGDGVELFVLSASTADEIDAAFATLRERRANALLILNDPFLFSRRDQIVGLATQQNLPTMATFREFVVAGGLASYGTSIADVFRHMGAYASKILNGARPADLPVEQVVKIEFVMNLTTAKAFGLRIPPTLLAFADEVIE
jgi:ABC-type uncharacterized transport system substrate-binding protein